MQRFATFCNVFSIVADWDICVKSRRGRDFVRCSPTVRGVDPTNRKNGTFGQVQLINWSRGRDGGCPPPPEGSRGAELPHRALPWGKDARVPAPPPYSPWLL